MADLIETEYEDFTAPELKLKNGDEIYAFWGSPAVGDKARTFACGTVAVPGFPIYLKSNDERAEAFVTHADYMKLEVALDKMLGVTD
jgi:hypothetical protein